MRVVAHRCLQDSNIKHPALVGFEPGHVEALSFERAEYVDHRLVFGQHRYQVSTAMLAVARGAQDRQVIRFGRPRSPDKSLGLRIEQCRQLRRRFGDMCAAAPAGGMNR